MRRRSSVEPSKILPSQVLHPTLQAALERLDVQLDEELARYRRLRVHQPRQPNRRQRLRQPDVVAVSALGGRTQPQTPQPQPVEQPAPVSANPVAADEQHPVQPEPVMSMAIASHLSTAEPGELASSSGSDLTADAKTVAQTLANQDDLGPDNYLESSEELLKSIAEEEALRAEREPGLLESLLTPLGIGSMLLLLLSSVTFGYVIMNPSSLNLLGAQKPSGNTNANSAVSNASPNAATDAPVASAGNSDALAGPDLTSQEFKDLNLNTLSTIPPNSTVQPTALPSAGAPGTSSGAVAPIAPANPASSNPVSPNPGINTALAPAPAAIPQVSVPRQVPAAQAPATADTPRRANTPARSTTRRAAQSERATTPVRRSRPVARPSTEQPSTVTRRSPSTSSSQASRSIPVAPPAAPARTSRPASSESARASRPAAPPSAQSGDRYYVVTRYNSDRSLTQARQAVGDAYVRNFPSGAQVQLGVFSERQRAQQLMQDLQQQGISAEVYQP